MKRFLFLNLMFVCYCFGCENSQKECYTFRGIKFDNIKADTFFKNDQFTYYWGQSINEIRYLSSLKEIIPRADTYAGYIEPKGCEGNQILLFKDSLRTKDSLQLLITEKFSFVDSLLFRYKITYSSINPLSPNEIERFKNEVYNSLVAYRDTIGLHRKDSVYQRISIDKYGVFIKYKNYKVDSLTKLKPYCLIDFRLK